MRLAVLSLAGHSDPERFVAEFSGSERTVAYAELAGHAINGKLTVDLEQTRLEDISGTWEHLKTGAARKLVVTP